MQVVLRVVGVLGDDLRIFGEGLRERPETLEQLRAVVAQDRAVQELPVVFDLLVEALQATRDQLERGARIAHAHLEQGEGVVRERDVERVLPPIGGLVGQIHRGVDPPLGLSEIATIGFVVARIKHRAAVGGP